MSYCTNSWVNSLVCEFAYFLLSGCPFRHSDPELLKQKLQSYKISPSGITQVRHILLDTFLNKAPLFNFTFYLCRNAVCNLSVCIVNYFFLWKVYTRILVFCLQCSHWCDDYHHYLFSLNIMSRFISMWIKSRNFLYFVLLHCD